MEQQDHDTAVVPTPKRVRIERNLYQRKDGVYEAVYTGTDGKQRLKTLGTTNKAEARQKLRDVLGKVDKGEEVAPSRRTFEEVANEYLDGLKALVAAGKMAPRTLERYKSNLDLHVLPALGRLSIQKVTPNHLADFFREKQDAGLSDNTCDGMKSPLARIFKRAVRRGYISHNPLDRLEQDELPHARNRRASRVLNRDELGKLLAKAPKKYRPVIATAAFTGMRLMELLGLTWDEVDFDANLIRVRHQLSRPTHEQPSRRVRLKTRAASRDIRLEPDLKALLLKHKMASKFKGDEDYVFATNTGTAIYYRNVSVRGLDKAADDAGLNPEGVARLVMHDLRHTYGSHLVRQGLDPVRVSRQMGHARPSITLDVYAKEFEQAQHADDVAEKLTAAFGGVL